MLSVPESASHWTESLRLVPNSLPPAQEAAAARETLLRNAAETLLDDYEDEVAENDPDDVVASSKKSRRRKVQFAVGGNADSNDDDDGDAGAPSRYGLLHCTNVDADVRHHVAVTLRTPPIELYDNVLLHLFYTGSPALARACKCVHQRVTQLRALLSRPSYYLSIDMLFFAGLLLMPSPRAF